jgi:hypothetical protein
VPISLPVDDEANELLSRNALALLIAMLLDQQVPLERAFSAALWNTASSGTELLKRVSALPGFRML